MPDWVSKATCRKYKLIYLADGSTVMCKLMGNINIPIVAKNKELDVNTVTG